MRFSLGSFFFLCLLPQASPSPTPLQRVPPPNILSADCTTSCQAAAQGPWSALPPAGPPTLQVLPVPTVIHDAVMSVRVLWENRWLPQIREIPGGLFTKGDRRGCRGNYSESRGPWDQHRWDSLHLQGWRKVGGEVTSK